MSTFDAWLHARKLNYSEAGRLFGVSRETIRRYCLPFDHPDRRFPSKRFLALIVEKTDGQITGHDFLPPAEGHLPHEHVKLAAVAP